MNLGLFLMPMSGPETPIIDVNERSLDMIQYADELGYSEAWVGEHYTAKREKIPSPDILIAQALNQTKNINLAAGAHLLPYHHPVELAQRIAYLDHLAQGRLMVGIAPGTLPTDRTLFGVDGASGQQHEMTAEALEIMLKLWTEEEPFEYEGKYWKTKTPEPLLDGDLSLHIKPYQKPFPPIGMAGGSSNSSTLKLAGKYGFIPMSLGVTPRVLEGHWNSVLEGAETSGKTPDRKEWRIVNHILVADTDEEAFDLTLNGMMGKTHEEYLLPLNRKAKLIDRFKLREDMEDEEVTSEYLAKHHWLIGSSETVAKKLLNLYEASGGFGTLLVTGYDYEGQTEAWYKSMRLLKEEVLPIFEKLKKQSVKV